MVENWVPIGNTQYWVSLAKADFAGAAAACLGMSATLVEPDTVVCLMGVTFCL